MMVRQQRGDQARSHIAGGTGYQNSHTIQPSPAIPNFRAGRERPEVEPGNRD
jgi:hypothetical protein